MEDACNEISDNTVDLVISLANIYIENIEKWSEIINDCISIAGGPGTWSTYASMLNKSISDHMKKQPEEFKSAVEKLGNVVIAEGIVDKCKNIRMDYWPHPTAEALSQ